MFFDLGAGEILGLAILGMILLGPERLPKAAAEAAKWVKKIRALSQTATAELRENLGPGFENLQPADLGELLDDTPAPKPARPTAKIDPDLI
jgi:sec-independent protein translocase protein TatB